MLDGEGKAEAVQYLASQGESNPEDVVDKAQRSSTRRDRPPLPKRGSQRRNRSAG